MDTRRNTFLKILHLEDIQADARLVELELKKSSLQVEIVVADRKETYIQMLSEYSPGLVLSDQTLPTIDSLEAIRLLREHSRKIPFILIAGPIPEEYAVKMMKAGVCDYILKDHLQRLPIAIANALEKARLESERERFVEEVLLSESLLKETERLAHIGSWQMDFLNGTAKWSEEMYRLFGYAPDEADPSFENFLKCIHPYDRKGVEDIFNNAVSSGDSLKIGFRILCGNGDIRYISSRLNIERDSYGNLVSAHGFDQDVTEARLAEEALKKSEANLRTIFNNTDTAYTLLDRDLNVIAFNPAIIDQANIYGISISEGANMRDLIPAGKKERIQNIINRVLGGEIASYEVRYPAGNSVKWFLVKWFPINSEDKPIGLMIATTDITEKKITEEKLEDVNREYNKLFNNIEEVLFSFDYVSYRVIQVSAACQKVYGYSTDEFKADPNLWKTLAHKDDRSIPESFYNEFIQGITVVSEYRIIHKNGSVRWISAKIIPTLDESGQLIRIDGVNTDITEKKNSQKELEASEARYRSLIEKSTDMKTLLAADGTLIYGSPSITRYLGYTAEEFMQKKGPEMVHPEDLPLMMERVQWLLDNPGESVFLQHRLSCRNGDWMWCEGSITNLLHEPDVNALVSNFRNITERKEAEKMLMKSESNLRTILENTDTGYILLDKNLRVLSFNTVGYEWVKKNTNVSMLEGMDILDGVDNERKEMARSLMTQALDGKLIEYEINYPDGKGSQKWYFVRMYPLESKEEDNYGICISVSDFTARKNEELEKDKMTNDLIRHIKDLEQFAYIVSHNLRAPVANILGTSDLLNDGDLDNEERHNLVQGLNASVKRLDNVVKDLNNILQIKRQVKEEKECVYFAVLLNDIAISINNLLKEEEVELQSDFFEVKHIMTLKSYLYSIFYNLVSNSIKYRRLDVHPVIEISSRRLNDKVALTFRDNGMGIDLNLRGDQVFGLYKRFHSHVEGKGMGLFMVKTQVEAIGGTISIKSEINKGTEFQIELPV